jgi:hypothetical protein
MCDWVEKRKAVSRNTPYYYVRIFFCAASSLRQRDHVLVLAIRMYKVYYRFRSQSPTSLVTLPIDGPYIGCKELAQQITNSSAFGTYKYATKDYLELTNAETGTVYKTCDIVATGTTVVVRKLPYNLTTTPLDSRILTTKSGTTTTLVTPNPNKVDHNSNKPVSSIRDKIPPQTTPIKNKIKRDTTMNRQRDIKSLQTKKVKISNVANGIARH